MYSINMIRIAYLSEHLILLAVDTEECLLKLEFGMEMAFDRAKILSKYLGELISYVKKKANLGKYGATFSL